MTGRFSAAHLLTPPPTPPSSRKLVSCSHPASRRAPSRPIPTEIWELVVAHLEKTGDIYPLLTVSKAWHAIAVRALYKCIVFTSIRQRNSFAAKLCGTKNAELAVEMRWITGKLQAIAIDEDHHSTSPIAPAAEIPELSLPSTKAYNGHFVPDLAILVKGIDFGFRSAPTASVPTFTPTPTPNSSAPGTPSSSAPASPTLQPAALPNSVAIAASLLESSLPYGVWEHRFVSPLLLMISHRCTHLSYLCLSGCQFGDSIFAEALAKLPELTKVDLSFSSVKWEGLQGVAQHCQKRLRWLDISGIFRFRRLRPTLVADILENCTSLSDLVINQCPDLHGCTDRWQKQYPHVILTASQLSIPWKESSHEQY
ncbi:uncharacterized protein SPPG_00186 [Spizellomyces punctatus DAOM BR117]|uniref:F-box domain-containing protein n=1 Tax=Spizellomyces punctatus (strain DAOM BR117) TaxID=645134 RepID=A0A0L0HTN4_SPIPD|nr:uncharacterized protein SPPG_00186 [Spizellomyces punctatus DAOM BR117]KND04457.1 hypothetical protein SPPG_00186 [Spizellomyces punctatus DAOM BR117]|eukprot:XP_016612496.1 hypothetical protein SPPG_00186 [Spizellomyces punctatus DAOM BR117]